MNFRFNAVAALLVAISAPQAANAQTASSAKPGMAVVDAGGGAVGSVTKVDANNITVRTDKYEIAVPAQSFSESGGKLYLGMTQVQLDAAWEKNLAAVAASLAVGAPVKGASGTEIGTIDAIDSEAVTIKLAGGQKIQLARSGIAGSPTGAVIGLTAQQLEAQLKTSSTGSK